MERELETLFKTYEVVILSGGVSKGKFDFVPAALKQLGVETIFHQVSQKPGKPLFCGTTKKQIIFGLPGNPVSSFLCFYRFVRPWLLGCMGITTPAESAVLESPVELNNTDLTHFVQVKTKQESGRRMAHPVPGGGSGDFANLREVDGFLEIPSGVKAEVGAAFPFIPFRLN
jgi:molybdopterin molybdotransferase